MVLLPQYHVAVFTVITEIMNKCVVKILITRNLLDLNILPFLLILYCCYYMQNTFFEDLQSDTGDVPTLIIFASADAEYAIHNV
jgi:mitochondrial fission protein ELM1